MSNDEFLLWAEQQEDKYELVDGLPVKKYGDEPELMANGRRNHAEVIANIAYALTSKLRGGPCKVLGDTFSVRTSLRKQRRPDILVECARGDRDDLEARAPTVLFEVLSLTSQREDLIFKPAEYKRIETVRQYVVVDPDRPLLQIWLKDEAGVWSDFPIASLDATLRLPSLGVDLLFTEIYEGVDLVETDLPSIG
jgi:Uma2 family endonuclease